MAKSFTDYVQTVIVKKGLTGLFQCPAISATFSFYIPHFTFHSMPFMHEVVPKAVNAAVRIDTTT